MKNSIFFFIRFVFALALCFGIYTETGIFTAIFAFFTFLGFEGTTFLIGRIQYNLINSGQELKLNSDLIKEVPTLIKLTPELLEQLKFSEEPFQLHEVALAQRLEEGDMLVVAPLLNYRCLNNSCDFRRFSINDIEKLMDKMCEAINAGAEKRGEEPIIDFKKIHGDNFFPDHIGEDDDKKWDN